MKSDSKRDRLLVNNSDPLSSGSYSASLSSSCSSSCSSSDLDDDGDGTARLVEFGEDEPPVDKYRLTYCIMLLMGTGLLLPYCSLVTAVDYLDEQFKGKHVEFLIPMVMNTPAPLLQVLMIKYGHTMSFTVRIVFWFCLESILLLCIPLIIGPFSEDVTLYIFLGIVFVLGCATSVLQSSLFGFAGLLPPVYTQAIMSGNGVAGLGTCVLRMATKVSFGLKTSALIYFSLGSLITFLCVIGYLLMLRLPTTKYYVTSQMTPDGKRISRKSSRRTTPAKMSREDRRAERARIANIAAKDDLSSVRALNLPSSLPDSSASRVSSTDSPLPPPSLIGPLDTDSNSGTNDSNGVPIVRNSAAAYQRAQQQHHHHQQMQRQRSNGGGGGGGGVPRVTLSGSIEEEIIGPNGTVTAPTDDNQDHLAYDFRLGGNSVSPSNYAPVPTSTTSTPNAVAWQPVPAISGPPSRQSSSGDSVSFQSPQQPDGRLYFPNGSLSPPSRGTPSPSPTSSASSAAPETPLLLSRQMSFKVFLEQTVGVKPKVHFADHAHHHRHHHDKHMGSVVSDSLDELSESDEEDEEVDYLALCKKIWRSAFSVWFIFFVTFIVYPGVVTEITSSMHLSQGWFSILLITEFNVFDLTGRTLAAWFSWFDAYSVLWPTLLRAGTIPLFILCTKPHLFVMDAWPYAFMLVFALSNGYLASIAMMHGPGIVEEHEREAAGYVLSFCLNLGILCGSNAALLLQHLKIIE